MNRMEAFEFIGPSLTPAPRTSQAVCSTRELDLESLWQAYTVSRDESLRNRLLIHYMPLSRMIAKHIHGRMPRDVDLDDLAQAAILGMRSAIATFDPARGIPFENFCGPRVRGAVLDHLRSLDWAPRMLRSRVQRVQEMTRQIEMQTGNRATDEEVSSALNMPLDELYSLRTGMAPSRIRATTSDDDAGHTVNLEMIPDRGNFDPMRAAQRADVRDFLTRGLSQIERQVVVYYYYQSMSLREIGEALSLCESRVSQIHLSVLKRLRERMHRIGGNSVDD